jgi:hypothetical protein
MMAADQISASILGSTDCDILTGISLVRCRHNEAMVQLWTSEGDELKCALDPQLAARFLDVTLARSVRYQGAFSVAWLTLLTLGNRDCFKPIPPRD